MYRTRVLPVDPTNPDPAIIDRAASWIRAGGLVAFPTETVYGLGANALDSEAVARIFEAKGRPANNPIIVHVPDAAVARDLVAAWPESAQQLADRFWPGPLTLVLPKSALIPNIVTAGGPTVALRAPANPIAQALLRAAGVPIAAPSANCSGRISPTRAEHVLRSLNGRIEYILDGGPTTGGIESTVLDLTTDPPRLLRPGLITPEQIEAVLGTRPVVPGPPASPDDPLPAPGMLPRHYAPAVPLHLVRSEDIQLAERDSRVGALVLDPRHAGPHTIVLPRDPAQYARALYSALHEMESAGVESILVEAPPDAPEWAAILDRLRRASS